MDIKKIATDRLDQLNCAKLPKNIVQSIIAEFINISEAQIRKLAQRHITTPRIARHFIAASNANNQKEDYLNLPPPQAEAGHIAGDNPPF